MHLFGLVSLGYMWAMMAKAAQEKLVEAPMARDFYEGKLITGALLHGAHHAGNGAAPRTHPDRRRHHDGTARRGVLGDSERIEGRQAERLIRQDARREETMAAMPAEILGISRVPPGLDDDVAML